MAQARLVPGGQVPRRSDVGDIESFHSSFFASILLRMEAQGRLVCVPR